MLGQAQRTYQAEMPMDVVGSDCGSIASWFRGRVDFPVHAPAFADHSNCKGGRLVNVGERLGAYLVCRTRAAIGSRCWSTTPVTKRSRRRTGG